MSDKSNTVICEINVWDEKFATRSAGPHRFIAIPRVGETLLAEFLGEEVRLRVREVMHLGQPVDEIPTKIKRLDVIEVHLTCEKV